MQKVINSEHEKCQMAPVEISGALPPQQPVLVLLPPPSQTFAQVPPPQTFAQVPPQPTMPVNPQALAQPGLDPISTAPGEVLYSKFWSSR